MAIDTRPARRQALRLLAGTGLATLLPATPSRGAAPASVCVVRPEQTEGPFFVDRVLERSDVRVDPATGATSAGVPLALSLRVMRAAGAACGPLSGAHVDLWQCDAAGVYSGVSDRDGAARGQAFLRGYQVTDATGLVRFTTIYPGAYPGRAVHIHFKIRSANGTARPFAFTSQLYFDDRLTDRVHAAAPYRSVRRMRNAADPIFRDGGDALLLAPIEQGDGFAAEFPIALQA